MGHSVKSVSEGREALDVNFEVAGIDQLQGATVIRGKANGVDSAILMNPGTFAKTAQALTLLAAGGLAACEDKPTADFTNSNISAHQQGLTAEDLLHMGRGQQVPWSIPGEDGASNISIMEGETVVIFGREKIASSPHLWSVRGQDIQDAILNGNPEEIIGVAGASSGAIYNNQNGGYGLLRPEGQLYEMPIGINANGTLEASGRSDNPFQPEMFPGVRISYFTQNNDPHLFYFGEATARTVNLRNGEDVDREIPVQEDPCGLPGVDSNSGLVVRSRPVRVGQSTLCRLFYAPSLEALNNQLSPIVTINNDPEMARKDIKNPRLAGNVLIYNVGDVGQGAKTLYYALVPEYCGNDVCAPDSEDVNNCAEDCRGGIDAALVDAAVQDAAIPDAAIQDAAIPDAAIPDAAIPDAAIPDAAIPDAAIPDAAIPDAAIPDAAIPDAAIPDAAIPDAAIPDAAIPDAEVPDAGPTPDQGVPPTPDQGVPPTPDQGVSPTPDEGVPPVNPVHAPWTIRLTTGNCVQGALIEVENAGVEMTEVEVSGDGTQTCKVSLDPNGPKSAATLTITSIDDEHVKVRIQLPHDISQNFEAEAANKHTAIVTKDGENHGAHGNINLLGVVTASAASEFLVAPRPDSTADRRIFDVASYNKPDEPLVMVLFDNGKRIFIPSDGKTYMVDVDMKSVPGLPELPICETGDEDCNVIPPVPPTAPPSISPEEETGGGEGCGGCSVGGKTLNNKEFFALCVALGLVGAAKPRRKKD